MRTGIDSLLNSMASFRSGTSIKEGIVGKGVEERSLFHDLEDGMFNRRSIRARQRVQVEGNDRDPVGELLWRVRSITGLLKINSERLTNILASRVKGVEVVQV